jgi:hypothetical protein
MWLGDDGDCASQCRDDGLVPTGDKDCCFTIIIGRKDMIRGLRQLGLTQLKL